MPSPWSFNLIQTMKPLLFSLLFLLQPATAFGEITLDRVLETLRKQSVAANSGDIKGLVAALPRKGFELLRKGSDEVVTMKKEEMASYLESYFKTIKPGTDL